MRPNEISNEHHLGGAFIKKNQPYLGKISILTNMFQMD